MGLGGGGWGRRKGSRGEAAVLARGEAIVDVLFHGAGHKHCFDGEPLRLGLRGGATLASLIREGVLVGEWCFLGIGR